MGFQSNPWDDQGTGAIEKDAPTGDFTETPDEVAQFLQDRSEDPVPFSTAVTARSATAPRKLIGVVTPELWSPEVEIDAS